MGQLLDNVRARSGRQETTMARAGTLPENAYYEDIVPANSNIGTNTRELNDENSDTAPEPLSYETTDDSDNEVNEYNNEFRVSEISKETTFLVGP